LLIFVFGADLFRERLNALNFFCFFLTKINLGRSIVGAFERWVEMVEELQDQKAKTRRIVQRMLNGCLVQVGP
jgi:hypothetical protein